MSVKACLSATLREAAWAPLGVFCLFVSAAFLLDLFARHPWVDIPAHLAGGMAMAYFFRTGFIHSRRILGRIAPVIELLGAFGLTALSALGWELLEFACDRVFGTTLNRGVTDTLSDLFFGLLGGGVLLAAAEIHASRARVLAACSLLLLIFLCLAWELGLAPLRPGGSLAALKALPLIVPLAGIFQGRRYTYQWSSMLILAYFAEGAMRAWAERGLGQSLALGEVTLSVAFFGAAVSYARLTRPALIASSPAGASLPSRSAPR